MVQKSTVDGSNSKAGVWVLALYTGNYYQELKYRVVFPNAIFNLFSYRNLFYQVIKTYVLIQYRKNIQWRVKGRGNQTIILQRSINGFKVNCIYFYPWSNMPPPPTTNWKRFHWPLNENFTMSRTGFTHFTLRVYKFEDLFSFQPLHWNNLRTDKFLISA